MVLISILTEYNTNNSKIRSARTSLYLGL